MEASIGERIRERRRELNIRMIDIHNKTGISTGLLSAWECGEKLPSAASLIKLVEILDCPADWLLFGKGPRERINHEGSLFVERSLEQELLTSFRKLDGIDQQEIIDIIHLKLKRKAP